MQAADRGESRGVGGGLKRPRAASELLAVARRRILIFGTAGGELLRARPAPKRLMRRSGVHRSGLGLQRSGEADASVGGALAGR